jgi:hypothetical protein
MLNDMSVFVIGPRFYCKLPPLPNLVGEDHDGEYKKGYHESP